MSEPQEEYKEFLCSYRYGRSQWSFEIQATSHSDAEARLKAIAQSGKVDGEIYAKIPAGKPDSLWSRFVFSILNKWRPVGYDRR